MGRDAPGPLRRTSEERVELVQVAHVLGPMGADDGWLAWLRFDAAELFDRYPSVEAAMAAAEAAP